MPTKNNLIDLIMKTKDEGEMFLKARNLNNQMNDITNFRIGFEEFYVNFRQMEIKLANMQKIVPDKIDLSRLKNGVSMLKKRIANEDFDRAFVISAVSDLVFINYKIDEMWKIYVDNRINPTLGLLSTIKNLTVDLPERQILNQNEIKIKNSTPWNPDIENAIKEYINISNKLINKLNLKDNVLNFLNLMASGKTVTINDLDIEVYEWLKENGFSTKVALSFVKK